ncbi:MAG: Bug family tripartite tricarboxylate transporter substrate binding protein [Hyphomicrobiaceae bacterium]
MRSTTLALSLGALTAAAVGVPARAETGQITLILPAAPGGSYDLVGRLVGRHIHKHLAGNPRIVPQNMPGAGGLIAANYIYRVAPQDGSVLSGLIADVLFNQIFKEKNVNFDGAKFQWIGNPFGGAPVTVVHSSAPVKSWKDVRSVETLIGATGTRGPDAMNALLANATLGTKLKLVTGYKGGQAIVLAMERGEVHGRSAQSWSGWKASKPDWVARGELVPLWQVARERSPELKHVPLLTELVEGEDNKALVAAFTAVGAMGRPLAMGPGVPAARVAEVRRAFDATVKDPAFAMEAQRLKVELGPISGQELQDIAVKITTLPPPLVAKLKGILREQENR